MSKPPLIGITAGNNPRMPGHYILRWDYVESLAAVGAIPVILAPSRAAENPGYVDNVDGVVLSGGMDVSPELYGQERAATVEQTSLERDQFELELLARAFEQGIPVLAICRGMQLLNVALGGNLVQDIPEALGLSIHDDPERPRQTLVHEVSIASGSRLESVFGCDRLLVNSFHHQAIDRLGDALVPVASADDGVIEAVEMSGDGFVVGVQWHPESLWTLGGSYLALFQALLEAACLQRDAPPPGRSRYSCRQVRRPVAESSG